MSKPWNLALTITLLDLPNPSLLDILILPPLPPPRNPIAQILIPNHLVLLLMTDPLFFREPFPLGQRFRFRQMFFPWEDGVRVGDWQLGERACWGSGEGEGEEVLEEVLGRTGGSVQEVGLEVGPVDVRAGSIVCIPWSQEE